MVHYILQPCLVRLLIRPSAHFLIHRYTRTEVRRSVHLLCGRRIPCRWTDCRYHPKRRFVVGFVRNDAKHTSVILTHRGEGEPMLGGGVATNRVAVVVQHPIVHLVFCQNAERSWTKLM